MIFITCVISSNEWIQLHEQAGRSWPGEEFSRHNDEISPGVSCRLTGTLIVVFLTATLTWILPCDSGRKALMIAIRKCGIDSASAWHFEPIFVDFETLDFRIERSRRQP